MVICLERGADLHMAQLMPLPLTVSCSIKIQIGFTFLVPAHLSNPGQRAVKRVMMRQCYDEMTSVSHQYTTTHTPHGDATQHTAHRSNKR